MEFCLLGPLLVRLDGTVIPVSPGRQRVVLAALLLNAGRVVSQDELAEALWGRCPPPSARVAVRNYVKRLRQALGEVGRSRIGTQSPGYVIRADAAELDVTRFEKLLGDARTAARDGSWDLAAGQARAALALWRGEPLADIDSELLATREVPRLTELRLQALETRIGADLHLGQHAGVITELRQLAATHPTRERLHGLLMLALYRDGRQAEALAAYQAARRVLVAEVGTEPGTSLRELHQQILVADPALELPEPGRPAAGGPDRAVPRELPAAVAHFAGRTRELAELTRLLGPAGEPGPGMVVISAIGGTAGVGKTALALRWAHQVAERFPDGQLYVNLRGYDSDQPVSAGDALARFLRALGVTGQDIPPDADERAARYRSLLATRRVLVIVDNASSVEQVRPLLPGASACVVVVTSRASLTSLAARDGARRLDLDLLPMADAVSLLRALIGERVDADPASAQALAAECCRLPLALRVAAQLAAARPAAPLAELVGELSDQQRRLDLLDADGDPRTAVRAVFSWSCRHLDLAAVRAFRRLSLHPGAELEPHAAAALTGSTVEQAGQLLGVLARAHMIAVAGPGRYAMHDLLRAYARELSADQDRDEQRQAALTCLFDHYLHTAAVAMDVLYPAEQHRRPRVPPAATPAPPLGDPAAARAWLDAERANLVAVARAAENGWPGHAIRLSATLHRYLDTGGHYPEAVTISTCGHRAAHHVGDHVGEATALAGLGGFEARQGSYQQATLHLQQSLALCRQTRDRAGEGIALSRLGTVGFWQGNYQDATSYYRQALAVSREVGDRLGEAIALTNLGHVDSHQGRYQQASGHLQQAAAQCRDMGYLTGEAQALGNLGNLCYRQGQHQRAISYHRQALALFRETGDRTGEGHALTDLGDACVQQGRHQEADGHFQQALALFREAGNRGGEADVLNGLGQLSLAVGQPDHARIRHDAALGLAARIGEKYGQARAHDGLADAYRTSGDFDQARYHWQQALALYTDLGNPEAEQIRARLAEADAADRQPQP